MLISPAKKRYDELQQRLREIRSVSAPYTGEPPAEVVELQAELTQLKEQIEAEAGTGPAILKG